jgi:hypothetical protein
MSMSRAARITVTALAATAVAAAATGITYAATTTTLSVVYACTNSHGTLRLLSSTGRCATGYTRIAMNRTGPRGPRGYTGSTGPRGSVGPTGPAGPGALSIHAASSTSTTDFADLPITGMGLTIHAVCSATQVGSQSGLYILDTDASADYDVVGSYNLSAPGAHAFLAYAGTSHPNLAAGLGPIEFTQPAQQNANSEFVLQYDSGAGGQMSADVTVKRSGKTLLIHLFLYQASAHCFIQADLTRSG